MYWIFILFMTQSVQHKSQRNYFLLLHLYHKTWSYHEPNQLCLCVCVCVCVCVFSCMRCVTLCGGEKYSTPLARKSASMYIGGEWTKVFYGKQNKLYLVPFEVFFLGYSLAIGNIRVIRNLGLLLRALPAWNCCDRSVMMNRRWNSLGFCNRRP